MKRIAMLLGCAATVATAATANGTTFDGRWILLQSTTTRADVPVLGEVDATTVAVSLHDVVTEGDRLRGPGVLCALSLDSGTSLAKTTLPPALRRVLPPPTLDAVVRSRDGKVSFWQATPTRLLGARLPRPDDALPEDAEDPRVVDDDRDGSPGVTVHVDGLVSGDLHVVQRTWSRLDGFLLRDGSFGGVIRHGVAQSILAATSPLLELGPQVRPLPSRSYFRLVRAEPGAVCGDAVRRVQELRR